MNVNPRFHATQVKLAKSGDQDALQWVCLHYNDKINSIIDFLMDKFNDIGPFLADREDLVQEGYVGIMKCIKASCQFSIWVAWYIFKEIEYSLYQKYFPHSVANYDVFSNKNFKQLIQTDDILIATCVAGGLHLPAVDSNEIYEKFEFEEMCHQVFCSASLTKQDVQVLLKYYSYCKTDAQIGKELNLSKARIHQVRHKALNQLRRYFNL